jgi:hypothetical protein
MWRTYATAAASLMLAIESAAANTVTFDAFSATGFINSAVTVYEGGFRID